ncbi:hypothetical protein CEXT_609791 [Caerostris extrusa]|uniref:Secreted protein n=1 Tax=Caerostris extrusa TaxID=172846 RepID=A0AAV4RJ79_CAEEX|nr:hypothetical protein CEXT_609791 [Caerostris extrusa]
MNFIELFPHKCRYILLLSLLQVSPFLRSRSQPCCGLADVVAGIFHLVSSPPGCRPVVVGCRSVEGEPTLLSFPNHSRTLVEECLAKRRNLQGLTFWNLQQPFAVCNE